MSCLTFTSLEQGSIELVLEADGTSLPLHLTETLLPYNSWYLVNCFLNYQTKVYDRESPLKWCLFCSLKVSMRSRLLPISRMSELKELQMCMTVSIHYIPLYNVRPVYPYWHQVFNSRKKWTASPLKYSRLMLTSIWSIWSLEVWVPCQGFIYPKRKVHKPWPWKVHTS